MRFRSLTFVALTLAVLALATAAPAQEPAPKVEIFAGYSWLHPDQDFVPANIPAGWGTAVTYNFHPNVGLTADFGGHYHDLVDVGTIMFGPKFTYRGERLLPFAHALFGLARLSPVGLDTDNTFGLALGGGLDVKVHKNVALRLIEADYMHAKPDFLGFSESTNNVRLRFGLNFLLGGGEPPVPPSAACSLQPSEIFAGEPVRAMVAPSNFNPKHTLNYSWTATGGKVQGDKETVNVDTTGLNPGSYTVSATVTSAKKAKDTASCNATFTVKERPKNPPQVACSANPASVQSGTPSTISCTCSSPDNSADYPVQASITNFTASAGAISPSGNNATLDTAGAAAGPITVNATCTDSRGLTAQGGASVNVEVPPPPPTASKLNECAFTNLGKLARVDNACKAILDDVALRLQRDPDAKGVVVGYTGKGRAGSKIAGMRAANVTEYVATEKGIDASRIEMRTSATAAEKAEMYIVPAGATFSEEGTAVYVPKAKKK